ncbi:MAG: hypothetical protein AB7O62_06595 [Pirellulales bacterium]
MRLNSTAGPWHFLLAVCLLFLAGCPTAENANAVKPAASLPFEGVSLRLLVAGDPPLAEAVRGLTGEWRTRSGATLEVTECEPVVLGTPDCPAADLAICPSAYLPTVATRPGVVPLPRDILSSGQFPWLDIFPNIRNDELNWNGNPVAVPLGSPPLVCYYRPDLLQKADQKPPKTWKEYQQLAALLAAGGPTGDKSAAQDDVWRGSLEPLAPGWAGVTLLARAAGYAKHPYAFSALFKSDSMEPLIATPPFVRALEELVAAAQLGEGDAPRLDPTGVREAFWQGHAPLALTWAHGGKQSGDADKPPFAAAFAEMPGAETVYDPAKEIWEPRRPDEPHRVTLLSAAGRLGVVLAGTSEKQVEAAQQLLFALAGPEWNPALRESSDRLSLFLQEHAETPRTWVERKADFASAQQYASVVRQSLSRGEILSVVRLPGRERYLAALDEAVERALAGASASESLQAAAEEWRRITKELGLDEQRQLYSAGLER